MQIGVEIIKTFSAMQQRANSVVFNKSVREILAGIGHPVLESYLALLLSKVGKRTVDATFTKVIFESALGMLEDESKRENADISRARYSFWSGPH